MKTAQIQDLAINALNDLKALDLVFFDVKKQTSITDIMVICSGTSTRHVKSLAENVVKQAKAQHLSYIKMEGEQEGEWVIVDLADVVVHVMLPAARELYRLEELWGTVQEHRERHANSSARHRE